MKAIIQFHFKRWMFTFAGIALVAMPAFAQSTYFSEGSKSISRLGVQGTGYYVGFTEAFGQNCQWGNAYMSADRKGMYALILAAKLANRRVSRVDYSQPGGNGTQCFLEIVELAD